VKGRVLAAWETSKQVYFAGVTRAGSSPIAPVPAPGDGKNRKHGINKNNDREAA